MSKDSITNSLKGLRKLRVNISHARIISISALLLILFIAFTIRILPLRWEIPSGTIRLNEFDPYYQFILTRHMVQNGLLSPYYPTPWTETHLWYPQGLDMSNSLPGLPMTAAALYTVISFLGVNIDLMAFTSFLPAIAGMLSALVIYFLGKDIAGKPAGLIAALFLALSPSFIQRTALGFFDTEVPGILGLVLFIFLFLRATDETRSLKSSLLYTFLSSLVLSYFLVSWGAAYYMLGLSALFVFVLMLLKRYSPRLLLSYSIIFGIAFFVATKFPGISLNYLSSAAGIPVAGVFLLLCLSEVQRNNISLQTKLLLTAAISAIIIIGFIALWQLGYMQSIAGKFITVIDPFIRAANPLIESVAEHRISAWGNIYYELGIGILFFLAGLYFTLRNPTNRNIFLLLFGLTSLYFAASMVRLLAVFAPAFALLVASGVTGILRPFFTLLKEAPQVLTRAKRGIARVSKEYSGIAVLLVFTLLVTNLAFSPQNSGMPRVYAQAYNPLTVTSSSTPIGTNVPEWINMLLYTQNNLQPTDVVAAWWDYGYWLGILGNVTSLADNATVNATQIENVGFMMMANETNSLRMLEQYNAKYILVFITLQVQRSSATGGYVAQLSRYGDEGKWTWMAKISGQAEQRFIDTGYIDAASAWTDETKFGTVNNSTGAWDWNTQGKNSVVYKLMDWAKQRWTEVGGLQYTVSSDTTAVEPTFFNEKYFSGEDTGAFNYVIGYDSSGNPVGFVPIVALYEIDWDAYHTATNSTG
ncbi:MAG TPA: STT3 domain-containing protein [Candidatus Bathyarchaeia archaeon]